MTPHEQTDSRVAGAQLIVERLRAADHQALWAGGCVRDQLLGKAAKDIDIATSARPEEIESYFEKTVAIGKAFGVIGVVLNDHFFEVATFRQDGDYQDGRRPNHVTFAEAEADAHRRDFTINALFYDPVAQSVIDYVGGEADLQTKIIRAVGDPARRFAEDHLRMLRAIRFAGTLDFTIDPATWDAIIQLAPRIQRISPERIREELTRMLTESQRPGHTLRILHESGLLAQVLPEVAAMVGVEQPPEFHPEGDVFTHTCLMLDLLGPPPRPLELVWAVLLHDVGKPPTFCAATDRIRFNGHDRVGAHMSEQILRRLRFPNAVIDNVVHCVANHMKFMHVQEMRRGKLRAMLAAPTFPTELELHRVDCLSSHADLQNYDFLKEQQEAFQNEPQLPPAWIRGGDVIALGVQPGPAIGAWLRKAYARQLDNEAQDRDELLEWLRNQIQAGEKPE